MTAFEMRISYWRSDVCSSDLPTIGTAPTRLVSSTLTCAMAQPLPTPSTTSPRTGGRSTPECPRPPRPGRSPRAAQRVTATGAGPPVGLLGRGLHRAPGLRARPDPLAPPDHHRQVPCRRVAHRDPPPILRHRPGPAPAPAHDRHRGLHPALPLELPLHPPDDLEAGRAEPPS